MSAAAQTTKTDPAPRTEPMRDDDVARLRSQLALGRTSRRAVAGVGLGCLGIGAAVGAILAGSGELLGAIVFPALLGPTGALFLWLAARAQSSIEHDLVHRRVAVLEGTVQTKREMRLPQSTAYVLQVQDQDVFVTAARFAQFERGDRIRIRRAPRSGIALGTELLDADAPP